MESKLVDPLLKMDQLSMHKSKTMGMKEESKFSKLNSS